MRRNRGLSRRDFVAAAVAIGGSSALSACQEAEGGDGTERTFGDVQAGQYVHLTRDGGVETVLEFEE